MLALVVALLHKVVNSIQWGMPPSANTPFNESSVQVRSKARREILARRPVGVEARERDPAASRAGEALVEVIARRVATARSRWMVVLALRVEGSERRLSVRLEPGRDGRPVVLVSQPLRRGCARRGAATRPHHSGRVAAFVRALRLRAHHLNSRIDSRRVRVRRAVAVSAATQSGV